MIGAQDTKLSGGGRVIEAIDHLFESIKDHGGVVRALEDESL
jgi:hypothetical protein